MCQPMTCKFFSIWIFCTLAKSMIKYIHQRVRCFRIIDFLFCHRGISNISAYMYLQCIINEDIAALRKIIDRSIYGDKKLQISKHSDSQPSYDSMTIARCIFFDVKFGRWMTPDGGFISPRKAHFYPKDRIFAYKWRQRYFVIISEHHFA